MPGRPTVEQTRTYLGVGTGPLPDDQLQRIYDGCADVQRARCRDTDDDATLPDALGQAFLRRVAREVAGKGLPLGLTGPDSTEFGPQALPFLDALIETGEAPYRRVTVG